MSHRDILAKLNINHFRVVQHQCHFPQKPLRPRPNLVPRSSSNAEIEFITLARPGFKLPPIASKGISDVKSFVLSSPNSSFKRLLIDENVFSDSPVVV